MVFWGKFPVRNFSVRIVSAEKSFCRKLFRRQLFPPEKASTGKYFSTGNFFRLKKSFRSYRLPAEIYRNSVFRFIFFGNYNYRRKKFWWKIGCPIAQLNWSLVLPCTVSTRPVGQNTEIRAQLEVGTRCRYTSTKRLLSWSSLSKSSID